MQTIQYIDQTDISNKRILLRVDFNVSLNPNHSIADDARIQQSLPTIDYLLKNQNKIIIISHLGNPEGRDPQLSLQPVCDRLQQYVPNCKVKLINDFMTEPLLTFQNQQANEIFVLENIRFYPEEKKNDPEFAKKLAAFGEIYINDAFGVSHRADASVVSLPQFLPHYGGLLMKKEIEMISKAINNPQKPVVAIMGGAKISTKINLIDKLTTIADHVLLGGGIANTLLFAKGVKIGNSLYEKDAVEAAHKLIDLAQQQNTNIILPQDAVVSKTKESHENEVKKIENIADDEMILDIGPETQADFGSIIDEAKTIIWNGPVGYFENPTYNRGTDFIYYSITENDNATSIVGGGDTLSAISKKEYLDKITHISTGGGAMLEFIEKGTLPGIEALIPNH